MEPCLHKVHILGSIKLVAVFFCAHLRTQCYWQVLYNYCSFFTQRLDILFSHRDIQNCIFPWRELLVNVLNPELRKDLAKIQGGKPEEYDALVAAIREVGLAHERYIQDEKRRTGGGKEKDFRFLPYSTPDFGT